jgi:dienelactone hydrolase
MTRHEITFKRVVYEIDGMAAIAVRRDVEYAASDAGPLTMDLYVPPRASAAAPAPAVILVGGYPDAGVPLTLGCTSKDMEMVISWAQLLAASGLIAIAYTKQDPARDTARLVAHVRAHASALGIDANRIGLLASSGNAPVALSLVMGDAPRLACAVFVSGFLLDGPESTAVADAAAMWKFANPTRGRTVGDVRSDVPLLIVRAGADQFAGLNAALERFVAGALERDLPLTVINHPGAPHAFDLFDPSEASRGVIREILRFFATRLGTIPVG